MHFRIAKKRGRRMRTLPQLLDRRANEASDPVADEYYVKNLMKAGRDDDPRLESLDLLIFCYRFLFVCDIRKRKGLFCVTRYVITELLLILLLNIHRLLFSIKNI
jgi:hypothetical protein